MHFRATHPIAAAAGSPDRPLNRLSGTRSAWARFWRDKADAFPAGAPDAPAGLSSARSEKMARLEAALFVADGASSTRRLAQFAMLADTAEVRDLIERLNAAYDQTASPFRVERVAAGYQLLTRPQYADWLNRIHRRQTALKLSPPAMETLTIIAYRQPIKRVDVEAIRGVQSAEIIKQLMERGLVKIGGEEDSLGRPYLYITTRKFFELFGLRTLDDLPNAEGLRRREETPQPEAPATIELPTAADAEDPDPDQDAESAGDAA